MDSLAMSEVVLYKAKNGNIQLDVNLTDETVWLSLLQLSELFGRDKSVISRHLNNIFNINELDRGQTVANFATVQKEGEKTVKREIEYYNLDVILSVGYRINSKEAISFRQWATNVLKQHLTHGYTVHEKRLAKRGVKELEQTVALLHRTLINNHLVNDIGSESIQLIISYAKTWHLLLAYDEEKLQLPEIGKKPVASLDYGAAMKAIESLKSDLSVRDEASSLFGIEREKGLESILGNIEQTFDGAPLYPNVEERSAHLLYFIVKDHPFTDGNKRIGCLMFLLYLKLQQVEIKLNENGLVALALLIAESEPTQKEMMVRLIVNFLID